MKVEKIKYDMMSYEKFKGGNMSQNKIAINAKLKIGIKDDRLTELKQQLKQVKILEKTGKDITERYNNKIKSMRMKKDIKEEMLKLTGKSSKSFKDENKIFKTNKEGLIGIRRRMFPFNMKIELLELWTLWELKQLLQNSRNLFPF